ncbi:DUF6053 domain-containing protein [Lysobacter yananisis]
MGGTSVPMLSAQVAAI